MTSGQRPYGGTNDPSAEEGVPGTQPTGETVQEDSDQSPRAAQGGMSTDVTRTPTGGSGDTKAGGVPDATGPQG